MEIRLKLNLALLSLMKKSVSKLYVLPLYAVLIVGGLFVFSVYKDFKNPVTIPIETIKLVPEVRYVNQPIQTRIVEVKVKEIVPTKKQEKKLEQDFKFDPIQSIPLTINKIQPLPNGGTELIKVDKVTGQVTSDIKPNKSKFFEFGGPWIGDIQYRMNGNLWGMAGKGIARIGPGTAYVGVYGPENGKPGVAIGYRATF